MVWFLWLCCFIVNLEKKKVIQKLRCQGPLTVFELMKTKCDPVVFLLLTQFYLFMYFSSWSLVDLQYFRCTERHIYIYGLYWSSDSKESVCNVGDLGSIPGLGRFPGEGNDKPLQYSCLENSMDRRTCWATVPRVAKSQTWLRDQNHYHHPSWYICMILYIQIIFHYRLLQDI